MSNIKRVADFGLFSVSNLRPSETGVPGAVIWISVGEFSGKGIQHEPCVKVAVGGRINAETMRNATSIRLTDPPLVAKGMPKLPAHTQKRVIEFVALNLDILLKYWNIEVSTLELLQGIRPVK